MDPVWWAKCLAIGVGGGLLSGMLGVGGGIIMVPMLMWLLGQPIHNAKAHSLAIIVLVSIAGTIQHHRIGRLQASDWGLILACGLSAMIAGPLGVSLGEKIDKVTLGRIFGLLMIFSGAKYLLPAKPAPEPVPAAVVATEGSEAR